MKTYTLASAQHADPAVRGWAYNALDCIATRQIADRLLPMVEGHPADSFTYGFERAAQTPAFDMTMRGTLVDVAALGKAAAQAKADELEAILIAQEDELVQTFWDGTEKVTGACPKSSRKDGHHTWAKGEADTPERLCVSCGCSRYAPAPFNPNSDDQKKHLLYTLLRAPRQTNKDGVLAVSDEALEKIGAKRPKLYELTQKLRRCSETQKARSSLDFKLSEFSRFHSSYSVGVVWTGRWSSSKDAFRLGGNGQNITEKFRCPFIPDPGYEFCYMDVKSAESNVVAHLSGDEGYINAHKGDTHTYVSHMTWPELDWPEDPANWRAFAESHYPDWDNVPGHDYRFQAKAVQHGTNLGLTVYGLARNSHITVAAATETQNRYFAAFPGVPGLQAFRKHQVEEMEPIYAPLGTRVKLTGRPLDGHTFRQGLAFPPQHTVAGIINIIAWRVWREVPEVQLLKQVHDAILFQFPKGRYDLVQKVMSLALVPLRISDYKGIERTVTLGVEASVGMNWSKRKVDKKTGKVSNPEGLVEWLEPSDTTQTTTS
jgi:DNA polymerase I-like protein with 3'-5' exonuclease and polymerase domains